MADSAQRHRNLYKSFIAGQRGGDTRVHGDRHGRQTEGFKLGGAARSGHAPRVGGGAFWFPLIGIAATVARTIAPTAIRAGIQAGRTAGARAAFSAAGRAAGQEALRVAPREVTMFGLSGAASRIGELTGLTDEAFRIGRNLLFGESVQTPSGLTVTQTQFGPQISTVNQMTPHQALLQARAQRAARPSQAAQEQIDVRRRAIAGRGIESAPAEADMKIEASVSSVSRRAAGERMLRRLRR